MRNKLLLLLAILPIFLTGQNVMPIGSWRSFPPKRVGLSVTQSTDQIFYATRAALMIMDKDELSTQFKTTVDGLTGVDFRLIRYHEPTQQLILVYEDGIIDLYQDGDIRTVSSIKNFTNITGEKTVNDIFQYDDELVFLAGTYGVSAFRLDNASFPFTTFMGAANVLSVAVFEGNIYAGTLDGIYRTSVNNPNVDDFSTWNYLDGEAGFPDVYSTNALTVYKDQLYIGIDEDIYRLENGVPVLFSDQDEAYGLRYFSAEGEYLLAGYRCEGSGCGNGQVLYFSEDGTGDKLASGCVGRTNYAIEDQSGRVWFGDEWMAFRRVNNITDEICSTFEINSPYSQRVWNMEVYEDTLWVAAGAFTNTRTPVATDHGMAAFGAGDWTIYNRWTSDTFKGFNQASDARDDDVFALIEVAINAVTNKVYGASYYTGLIEIDGDNIRLFNDTNSPLSNTNGDENRTRVSGMAVDEEGGLWVTNYRALEGRPLHRLAPDGTWVSFDENCGQNDLFQIEIDPNGFKWIISGSNTSGVLLFDEGELDNPNDDRCRSFTANNSNVPTNETNCLAIDQDGDVWVGTNQGIVIFECGGAAFDANCLGSLRTVDLDGFLEYLFKTQVVQSIAVDGANRKWVGTTNGAYLISPDGKDELLHFTVDNSPLPNNSVRSIALNQRTGEVFIGTDAGIVSYQGDAIEGSRVFSANPLVFPNPVRPEYDGPITVRGLATNADVKITDVNGKLVFETQALGGQVIWDGRDYNGRRVQTGVYLVFSSTNPREAGLAQPDAAVAKILFVN